jgi:hypothetical protein
MSDPVVIAIISTAGAVLTATITALIQKRKK